MPVQISIDHAKIEVFCRRHHIRRLSLFGSVLRHDFGPDSDVDVLVDFEPGENPGVAMMDMESELSAILGRRVDMVKENLLNRWIRKRVLQSKETLYDAA